MFSKNYFLMFILSLIGFTTQAQINQLNRIEFEYKDEFEKERIVPIGENGVLLFAKSKEKSGNKSTWIFRKYNTELEEQEEDKIVISKRMKAKEFYTEDNSFHVLFTDSKNAFEIISIDGEDGKLLRFGGELPKKAVIQDLKVIGDWAITKAFLKKEQQIFAINWKTGETKIVPIMVDGYKPKDLRISDFQLLKDENELLVYISAFRKSDLFDLVLLKLDENGNKVAQHTLTKDLEQNIIEISGSKLSENKYVFTGTYGKYSTTSSIGLFMAVVEDKSLSFINFYNFTDLEDFFSFLPENMQEKLAKKKARKSKKGKEMNVKYMINFNEIMERDGGYLIMGECYYPTYRTEKREVTYKDTNGNIRYKTETVRIFDGYKYTHAIVAKLDDEGMLEWNKSVDLRIFEKPLTKRQFTYVDEEYEDGLKFVYGTENNIIFVEISNEGELLNDQKHFFELGKDFKSVSTYKSASMPWYDNYYISYGFQKIKLDKSEDNDNKRKKKVVFINKIEIG